MVDRATRLVAVAVVVVEPRQQVAQQSPATKEVALVATEPRRLSPDHQSPMPVVVLADHGIRSQPEQPELAVVELAVLQRLAVTLP
jgi:hypothetical protein